MARRIHYEGHEECKATPASWKALKGRGQKSNWSLSSCYNSMWSFVVSKGTSHKIRRYIHLFVASEPCQPGGQADSNTEVGAPDRTHIASTNNKLSYLQ